MQWQDMLSQVRPRLGHFRQRSSSLSEVMTGMATSVHVKLV